MKSAAIFLLSVFSILYFTSCEKVIGEGPIVMETRSVSNFKSVSVSVSGKVNYKIDPVYKIEIEAQRNILDILQTHKVGDELVIKFQDGKRVKEHEDIVVTISAPYAEAVNLSGSAEFNLTNNVISDDMRLRISGSGNINVSQVTLTDELIATISGSGNISINRGTAKNENFKISGSGGIRAGNVVAEKATTEISGSGDMEVNATQRLDASISGSGNVYYKGNPVILAHVSGSGKVRPF